MNIELKNCNNIDFGAVEIKEARLNIKYAINGTGKTTISRAIEIGIDDTKSLDGLTPFKYRNGESIEDTNKPSVTGIESLSSISIFNEEYVKRCIFKKDEIIENSFEIFIRNSDYDDRMEQIEQLITAIKTTFSNSEELETLTRDLMELSECFGKSQSGYSAAGSIGKGIGNGNKLDHIPEGLEVYSEFLKSSNNIQWLKWQIGGNGYLDITDKCPYCTGEIESKKETVLKISTEYNSKMVEHLNKVISVFQRLSKYFSEDTNLKIDIITHNIDGITKEQKTYLIHIKEQIDNMIENLLGIKDIGYFALKDVQKIVDIFSDYRIDLEFYTHLDTEETKKLIDKINESIDVVLDKAGLLQGEINKQTRGIENTISRYNEEINEFLRYAGYKYFVDIELDEDKKHRMRLRHIDNQNKIEQVDDHLSFGERNAFSLVLFMYDTLKKDVDLIILDDPISSFDKNKKFAIINMLFRGANTFKDKTVLMLTHDFEPIIDMQYNLPRKFYPRPYVTFLQTDEGQLQEIEIKKNDIMTFIEIANENISNLEENINKLIYLRRLYEISLNKNEAYNLISNLLHKRSKPIVRVIGEKDVDEWRDMTDEELSAANIEINGKIIDFDYESILSDLIDQRKMVKIFREAKNNYERLQLYRIIFNGNNDNDVVKKFVNETFHIENDYILQLNPCKFEIIPKYIIDECEKDIKKIEII